MPPIDPPTPAAGRSRFRLLALCMLLATPMTLLNAAKPLVMDDSLYAHYAHAIAADPGDPYGFVLRGYDIPAPAIRVLCPVALHYWWSLAIRLFGESPVLWKLWLFPFHVVFVASLHALFSRFAPRLQAPLTVLTAYSPLFLPSTNLMLDVPSLAVGLAAVVLFLGSCDRGDWPRALLAGVLAAVSAQMKYTGLLVPAVFLAAGLVAGRAALVRAAVATLVAGALFVGWEAWIAHRYGASHFLVQIGMRPETRLVDKVNLVRALLSNLGGLAPALTMFGLVALGRSRSRLAASAVALTVGALAAPIVGPNIPIFTVMGAWFAAILVRAARRQLGARAPDGPGVARPAGIEPGAAFLVLWLVVEVLGTLVLSPFSATRRLMGPVVVATLILGRLAARRGAVGAGPWSRPAWLCAAASAAMGLGFCAVEARDARAVRDSAGAAARYLDGLDGGRHARWYVGRWGFRYYADRAGMRIVTPGLGPLRRGDWLVVPDATIIRPALRLDPRCLEPVHTITADDALPLRMLPTYYGGNVPIEAVRGHRFSVRIYRVRRDFTPTLAPTSRRAADATGSPRR